MDDLRGVRVFVSYSHDSDEYRSSVLELAQRLRGDGVECVLDQFFPFPEEGWVRWMQRQLTAADFVLCCCSERYASYFEGVDGGGESGRGSNWEGLLISQQLHEQRTSNTKFIPVTLGARSVEKSVPVPLRPYTRFVLYRDYDELYRLLTGQPNVAPVPIGSIRQLSAVSPGAPNSGESLDDAALVEGYIRSMINGADGDEYGALYELERTVDHQDSRVLLESAIRRLVSYITALDTSTSYSTHERLLRSQVVRTLIRLTNGDIGRYLPPGALSSIDLALFDFRGGDLSGVDFSGSFMIECDFRGVPLDNCCFDGCLLRNVRFDGATLNGATLNGATFRQADWFNALGLTLPQVRTADVTTMPPPPAGEERLMGYLAGAYRFPFKSWGRRVQGELLGTWRKYAEPGGVYSAVSR